MRIQDCFPDLNVIHKPTGKPATVQSISVKDGRVVIALANGTTATVNPRDLDQAAGDATAATVDAAPAEERVPMRPCPSCAKRMPVTATECPACGFTYAERQSSAFRRLAHRTGAISKMVFTRPKPSDNPQEKSSSGMVVILIRLLLLAAVGFAIWKFVLSR